MSEIPADIMQTATALAQKFLGMAPAYPEQFQLRDVIARAILAERERFAACLEEEADLTPCAEDAMVTRSNANLIRANFSYEDAERLSEAAHSPTPEQEERT